MYGRLFVGYRVVGAHFFFYIFVGSEHGSMWSISSSFYLKACQGHEEIVACHSLSSLFHFLTLCFIWEQWFKLVFISSFCTYAFSNLYTWQQDFLGFDRIIISIVFRFSIILVRLRLSCLCGKRKVLSCPFLSRHNSVYGLVLFKFVDFYTHFLF